MYNVYVLNTIHDVNVKRYIETPDKLVQNAVNGADRNDARNFNFSIKFYTLTCTIFCRSKQFTQENLEQNSTFFLSSYEISKLFYKIELKQCMSSSLLSLE